MRTNFVEEKNTLMFKNPDGIQGSTAHIITSKIKQFEALTNCKPEEFFYPSVLLFDQPWLLHLVNFNFEFPVDVILVDDVGIAINTFTEPFRKSSASYIRGFSSVKMVILCPKGFIMDYKIAKNETIIELTTHEIFYNYLVEEWKNEYGKMTIERLEYTIKKYVGTGASRKAASMQYKLMKEELAKKIKKNKVYTLNFQEEDEVKLFFVALIINVESINRVFGDLQDFVQEYQIEGNSNGKLLIICDMTYPSDEIDKVIINCLRPLGLKERNDFVVAEEVIVNGRYEDCCEFDISYWHKEHPQLRHLDWLESICLEDGNWIWHK